MSIREDGGHSCSRFPKKTLEANHCASLLLTTQAGIYSSPRDLFLDWIKIAVTFAEKFCTIIGLIQ